MKKKISLPELSYRKKLLHLAKFYKIVEVKKNLLKRRLTNKQIELLLKKNEPSEVKDCFEKINRATFAFNQGLDKALIKPIAKRYRNLPPPVRKGTNPRRVSFAARFGGMKGPMKDSKGRPTRKALALRKWGFRNASSARAFDNRHKKS